MKAFPFEWTAESSNNWWHEAANLKFCQYGFPAFYETMYKKAAKFISINPNDAVLDYSCGDGQFFATLKKHTSAKCYGCGLDEKQIQVARAQYPDVPVERCTPEWMESHKEQFDIIFVNFILSTTDLASVNAILQSIASLLKPHGKCCITDSWNDAAPVKDTLCPNCGALFSGIPYLSILNPEKLSALAKPFGLALIGQCDWTMPHVPASKVYAFFERVHHWWKYRHGLDFMCAFEKSSAR